MIIFIGIIAVILSMTSNLFTKKEGAIKNWHELYNTTKINHDVLIVGSSIAYSSFKPNLISAKLGVSSFNLSSATLNVEQLYFNIKEALKYHTPELLIMEAHSLDIPSSNEGKALNFAYENIDGQKNSLNKLQSVANVFEPKYWLDAIFPVVRNHHEWANFDLIEKNLEFEFVLDEKMGYKPLKVDNSAKRITQTADVIPSSYEIPEENYYYLEKITKLCKDKNIKFLLVRSPQIQYQPNRKFCEEIYNTTAQISKDLGIEYIDYNYQYNDTGFAQSDFYDALHLNENGAEKLTQDLAVSISKKYDLKENKNLIHREAEYYLENNRFLNSRRLLTETFIPKEGIHIDQIFIQKTIEDEYCFFIGFNPNTNVEELNKYNIAIQLVPIASEKVLLETKMDKDREMISFGNYPYPLESKDDYLVRAIGFRRIVPKNFKTFRLYLYNKDGASEKVVISNFNIDATNESIKNNAVTKLENTNTKENNTSEEVRTETDTKSTEKITPEIEKTATTLTSTAHAFKENLVFKNVNIVETSANTYTLTIEIDKNKTDIEELKLWKLAMQVFPEEPKELENFKNDGKNFKSNGFLIQPIQEGDKTLLTYKNIKLNPTKIKLLRFYLYRKNNEMIKNYYDTRDIELPKK
ncbi:hypothetical protein [Kordia sp.]|uniref:hypothetical protein n=1 Tax=Kordia sp. TaxID=1965332 RepID=UPI003D2B57E1